MNSQFYFFCRSKLFLKNFAFLFHVFFLIFAQSEEIPDRSRSVFRGEVIFLQTFLLSSPYQAVIHKACQSVIGVQKSSETAK